MTADQNPRKSTNSDHSFNTSTEGKQSSTMNPQSSLSPPPPPPASSSSSSSALSSIVSPRSISASSSVDSLAHKSLHVHTWEEHSREEEDQAHDEHADENAGLLSSSQHSPASKGSGMSSPTPVKKKNYIRRRDRVYPDVLKDGWGAYIQRSLHKVFLTSWLNFLMLLLPFWLFSWIMEWSDVATLFLGLFCLCPLAERLAAVTDELSFYASDALCGLISATMGNLAELIVTIFLIVHGMTQVVQLSLIGSILGNLFLVTGCAFFAGGLRYVNQVYNRRAVNTYTTFLFVSLMFLCFPATFSVANWNAPSDTLLGVSRLSSLLMLLGYSLLLLYQFRTHTFIFDSEGDEEDKGIPVLGLGGAVFWIVLITAIISLISDSVVDSLEAGAKGAGIPPLFIAAIMLPLFGNVAEHAAAILFAWRNRMDLSLAVSIGSAAQIALFVFPLSVIIAWMADVPLTMNIGGFETLVMLISVLVGGLLVSTGESDWLRGAMLIIAFIIVCVVFWAQTTPMELKIEFSETLILEP